MKRRPPKSPAPKSRFTEKLRAITKEQNAAAKSRAAGLAPTAIGNYIAKGSIPRADIALKIARALNVADETCEADSIPSPTQTAAHIDGRRWPAVTIDRQRRGAVIGGVFVPAAQMAALLGELV